MNGDGCDATCLLEPEQPAASAADFALQNVRPLRVRIARGAATAKKSLQVVITTTTTPSAARTVTLTAQDGTCPAGTVGSPAPNSVKLARRRVRALVPVTVRSAAFTSRSRKSPASCTVVVTATSSDSSGRQQTTQVELNVTDVNDL